MASFNFKGVGATLPTFKNHPQGSHKLGGIGGKLLPSDGVTAHNVQIGGVGRGRDRKGNIFRGDLGYEEKYAGGLTLFLHQVMRPGAFTNKHTYELTIIAPRGLTTPKDLGMRCESITLPGTNVETSQDNLRKGPSREHAFNMNYGPVSGTFLCDRDQKERTWFHDWQKLCVADQDDGWGVGYFDNYATEVIIKQFDLSGEKSFECKLIDCFPKSIGPETLTLADTELMRISVEFVFHRWEQI